MKRILFIVFISGLLSCSKEQVETSIGGCNFNFKGKNHITTIVNCESNGVLVSEGDIFAIFIVPSDKLLQLEYQNGPYLNRNTDLKKEGKTISFNTTIKSNNNGQTETITGKCSCSF